jgi:hypothetical protein
MITVIEFVCAVINKLCGQRKTHHIHVNHHTVNKTLHFQILRPLVFESTADGQHKNHKLYLHLKKVVWRFAINKATDTNQDYLTIISADWSRLFSPADVRTTVRICCSQHWWDMVLTVVFSFEYSRFYATLLIVSLYCEKQCVMQDWLYFTMILLTCKIIALCFSISVCGCRLGVLLSHLGQLHTSHFFSPLGSRQRGPDTIWVAANCAVGTGSVRWKLLCC